MITNQEATELLEKLLDKLDHKPYDCEMSDWEVDFLESNRGRSSFSDKQIEVIERIADKN